MNLNILTLLCIAFAVFLGFAESASKYKSIAQKVGKCPPATSILGTCIRDNRDPSLNCLSDSVCPNEQKCCREGCNKKVCKLPIQDQFFENSDWPDFGLNKVDWSWWYKSKNFVQGIYDKFWESAATAT